MNFEDFHFHPDVMSGVKAAGYETPTPIQSQAIPPIMEGRDLIGLAQTGTGKTAVFVLPVLHRLLKAPRGRVGALIISPTRELAEQTTEAVTELGRRTGLRGLSVYGGVSMEHQLRGLRGGIEIVVACPGRLIDHLLQGTITLEHLQVLIIDEADRMFDMGFLPDIKTILKCILHRKQTLLFSATMPEDIRKLAREILHDPVTVQIGQTAPANTVSHSLYPVSQQQKTSLLKTILRETGQGSVLVFTRTKFRAERVAQQLRADGYRVTSLQGNLSQPQRQAALDGFRNGYYRVLVATDIAARGIDVEGISHVINYDMPDGTDAYIHRIGRTGRVGNAGEAYTLVTKEDEAMIRSIERILKAPLERRTLENFDYGAFESESRPVRRAPVFARGRRAR